MTEVVAYRTAVPESLDAQIVERMQRAEVDAIVFASPSAYHNLSDAIGREAPGGTFVASGLCRDWANDGTRIA